MKSGSAYLKETTYHKCLFISTCEQYSMEFITMTKNDVQNSDMTDNDQR